jgi:hypothetical protein
MTTVTLKIAESVIAVITSMIQWIMSAVIAYMFVLLAVVSFNHNVQVNRVECGRYITDSTHAWIEVVNRNDNSRIATLTIDCNVTNTLSIIDVKWGK